ncbi:carcinoembryonic antigen-related cell adhesion molecule 1-like isoform X2 [Amphiprion ocellaris]|uniref:carcinoembryonic antigen-related cell adhesion molecule 1-like isoform X2 n=1 Tax=Amphiprion ocellaris TaxID=80972 RepID=UPI002410C2B1|nr:carcinoembryonic antigen-related cell adhesion molecule 1-like isoform X2 [Amphiprion ocellaris]
MAKLPLLFIVFVAFTGLTEGAGVLPDGPLNATVGGTFLFTTSLTPTETPFVVVNWFFGVNNIITSHAASNTTPPEYEGRITLFLSTGSLELRSLTDADSGEYIINITPAAGGALTGSTTLNIYEPVSNVAVHPKSADLVEFSSVILSCTSFGSSISFLWLNDTSEVTASDRVHLTDGGSTLTIVNVTRYDQQPFRCHVFNPVSNDTSEPVNIIISFGPENTNLLLSPSEEYFAEGSDVRLFCSTESRPPAQFMWFLNGESLPHSEPELNLTNIQMNNTGNYSCQAFNDKTMRNETSQLTAISVLAHVANIVVTSDSTDLVEFNSSVSLSCTSSGTLLSFLWLNGSSKVTENDRVQLTDGGSSLTIVNVSRYDQGPFTCQVFNPVSNGTSSPINLSISYGPENIELIRSSSQEFIEEGSNIGLSCSAVSRPAALFKWFLNGNLLADTGSELTLTNIQLSQSGNYSCQAFNSKTLRYQTSQPSAITVLEKILGASVKPSTTLIDEGTSINLTCEASGSIWTRMWKKDGSDLILADNMTLSENNRLLSFNPVNRNDNGEYFCNVSNPISSDGAKYNLVVNYESPGCSAGCIAGIVIACCVFVAVAVGVGFYVYRKKLRWLSLHQAASAWTSSLYGVSYGEP